MHIFARVNIETIVEKGAIAKMLLRMALDYLLKVELYTIAVWASFARLKIAKLLIIKLEVVY